MAQLINKKLLQAMAVLLKELRGKKNLSQQEVNSDTGIHLGRIETGKHNFSVSTLDALCKYYEISPMEFYKRVETIDKELKIK
jgi:transcriptional regulator with XRE-family HTH domain